MNNYYILYVTGHCPWCVKAINLLNESGLEYAVTLLDQALDYRRHLKNKYKWDTVPIVIEVAPSGEEKLIGGYTDLVQRFRELGFVENDHPDYVVKDQTSTDTVTSHTSEDPEYVIENCGEQGCPIDPEDSPSVSE